MALKYLQLDKPMEPVSEENSGHVQHRVLVPVCDRVLFRETTFFEDGGKEAEKVTYISLSGREGWEEVTQDFNTIKAMLTKTGAKIIEPPAPKGTRMAKVVGPEISMR